MSNLVLEENLLLQKRKEKTLASQEVANFKTEVQRFGTSVVKKLFEISPIKCGFVKFCLIFDPAVILSCETKVLQKRFKSLLSQYMISRIFSPNHCDSVMLEFTSFIDNELKKYRAKVEEFDKNHDRLDDFYFNQVFANNYDDLSFFIKVVLTLSHCQASTERQFSFNNTVLDNNMKEENTIARKHIIDLMRSKKLMPYYIEINKDLYSSVKGASARYKEHLEGHLEWHAKAKKAV